MGYAIDGIISQARNLGIDYGVYWSVPERRPCAWGCCRKATGFAVAVAISITEKITLQGHSAQVL